MTFPRMTSKYLVAAVCLIVAVTAWAGYNGRLVLTIVGDGMSPAGKRKVGIKHAKVVGGCPDPVMVSNAWASFSHWRSKAKTNQTSRVAFDSFDKLRVGGRSARWKYPADFKSSVYLWATNNLTENDVKYFRVVIKSSGSWMTNDYTRIVQ